MSALVQAPKQGFGHFYDVQGNPVDGGLRMARKLGAFPSVTTIQSCGRNYGIELYKREQFGLALMTLDRKIGETDFEFIERANEDADAHSKSAMEKGTHIHGLWESLEEISLAELDPLDTHRIEIMREWREENILKIEKSEQVVVDKKHGFAGRFDTLCRIKDGTKTGSRTLLDLKTMNPKSGKMKPYESHLLQLSAYRLALGKDVECGNLLFNSSDKPEISFHKWDKAEVESATPAFLGLLAYWQWSNNYYPNQN